MEAMYLGKPIVASDIKGQNDLLPKKSLYPLNDMDGYLRCVKNTIVREERYETEKYFLDSVLEKNVEIYLQPTSNKNNG